MEEEVDEEMNEEVDEEEHLQVVVDRKASCGTHDAFRPTKTL